MSINWGNWLRSLSYGKKQCIKVGGCYHRNRPLKGNWSTMETLHRLLFWSDGFGRCWFIHADAFCKNGDWIVDHYNWCLVRSDDLDFRFDNFSWIPDGRNPWLWINCIILKFLEKWKVVLDKHSKTQHEGQRHELGKEPRRNRSLLPKKL